MKNNSTKKTDGLKHGENIIELQDVNFSYGHDQVLKNINLTVHKGDYLGIVGPNGGGKSTLLRLILGLLTPSSGNIILFGQNIENFKNWSKFGYISQQVTHIDPNFPMSVMDVVIMGTYAKLGLFKTPGKGEKEKAREALEKVGMWEYKDKLIGDLSGGQQQRVFIARALAGEPEIIVLDEPTTGVDIKTQKEFYSLLQSLNSKLEMTLVLVSHELDIVAHESTEIAYINRELIYHGVPRDFLESEYLERLTGKGAHVDI